MDRKTDWRTAWLVEAVLQATSGYRSRHAKETLEEIGVPPEVIKRLLDSSYQDRRRGFR